MLSQKNKYFKGLDYHDRESAKVTLGRVLESQGWKLYGYHAGRPQGPGDDYSDMPSWDGIATKGAGVLVVDNSRPNNSGRKITRTDADKVTCETCKGAGHDTDPEAWTLEMAQADPYPFYVFKLLMENTGSKQVTGADVPTVITAHGSPMSVPQYKAVSPLFFKDGKLRCPACKGKGHREVNIGETVIDTWPVFQASPPRKGWHLEISGRIVTDGISIAKMARCYYEGHSREQQQAAESAAIDFAGEMEAYIKRPAASIAGPAGVEIVDYSEKAIVVRGDTFPIKDKLKTAGGKFNKFFKAPDGSKYAGWVFSKKHREEVTALLNG